MGKSCVDRESFREDWSLCWAALFGGEGGEEGERAGTRGSGRERDSSAQAWVFEALEHKTMASSVEMPKKVDG